MRELAVFERRPVVILSSRSLLDRLADQVAVAVDAGELLDDCVLQLLARDAVAVARFGAALLAAGAGVVVVEAAVAYPSMVFMAR